MTPRISVVVPTYRRAELLARCLGTLVNQNLSADDYEVVIADDAANEATRDMVHNLALSTRPALRYVAVTGNHGPAAARNVGWRTAVGEVIAFTDDDTIPDANWLAAGLALFGRDTELAAATGRTVVPLPHCPTDYERNESGLATAEFITANCFVRRSALETVGGFDERFRAAWREDSDLHFALLEAGLKVMKIPDAVVVHPVRPAPWGVSLRLQRKSQYDALLYTKHPELFRERLAFGRPWHYYATVTALAFGITAAAFGEWWLALAGGATWAVLTAWFAARRLRGNSLRKEHVAEMLVTSALIPPLSVFWRLYGATRFRTMFY